VPNGRPHQFGDVACWASGLERGDVVPAVFLRELGFRGRYPGQESASRPKARPSSPAPAGKPNDGAVTSIQAHDEPGPSAARHRWTPNCFWAEGPGSRLPREGACGPGSPSPSPGAGAREQRVVYSSSSAGRRHRAGRWSSTLDYIWEILFPRATNGGFGPQKGCHDLARVQFTRPGRLALSHHPPGPAARIRPPKVGTTCR